MKPETHQPANANPGLAGRVAAAFVNSRLTPLVIITSVLLGVAAVWLLPREEEPQIKVPIVDVMVSMPGFSSQEVEERATRPMEKLLWEIAGVEYICSTSHPVWRATRLSTRGRGHHRWRGGTGAIRLLRQRRGELRQRRSTARRHSQHRQAPWNQRHHRCQ